VILQISALGKWNQSEHLLPEGESIIAQDKHGAVLGSEFK
jgi:hypothetical protein